METEKLLEVVRRAKEMAPNYEAKELAESYEEFLLLFADRQNPQAKGPDFMHKLMSAQKRVEVAIVTASAKYGMTPNQMKEFLGNSANFSQTEWTKMQQIKEELGSEKKDATASIAAPRKLRKSKPHTLRI